MIDISQKEIWFVTGSQHLYGEETLRQVAENSQQIVNGFNAPLLHPFNLTTYLSLTRQQKSNYFLRKLKMCR